MIPEKRPHINYEMGKMYLQVDKGDYNYFIAKKWGPRNLYLLVDLLSLGHDGYAEIQLNRRWEYFSLETKEYLFPKKVYHKIIGKIFDDKVLNISFRDNRRHFGNGTHL